ncbi:Ground-like domain family protein [Brugia pahangi]
MKQIVILFECILLFPSYDTTFFDCCFMLKFPELCETLCNSHANLFSLQPAISSPTYATPSFPFTPTTTTQIYQINSLSEPISPVYAMQQLPPHHASHPSQQPYLPPLSQHGRLPAQQSNVRAQSSSSVLPYKQQRPNFAKEENIKDKEVADLLDAIEEFHNQTLQIQEPIKPIPISSLITIGDSECNDNKLKIIMLENIGKDLNATKKMIQLAAEAQFDGHFNVICSKDDFSFLTNTELFCQATKGDISCYAYRLYL